MLQRSSSSSVVCALLGLLCITIQGCDKREQVRNEAQRRIAAELEKRKDIPAADRDAAAAAIATDLVDVAAEGAAAQSELDANNRALEQALGGVEGAKSHECAQLQLELDALRRMLTEGNIEDANEAEVQKTIDATETRLTELCR